MKNLSIAALIWLSGLYLYAQISEISGLIKSADIPVAEVSIINKNTGEGTTSKVDGTFNLSAQKGDLIEISSIGFDDFIFNVSTETYYLIQLKKQNYNLDELVVTALDIKRSSKVLGYSVQKISSKEISEVKASNFLDNLGAKIAGVQVTQGASGIGSSSKISIRGEASFTNNNPLFVVDGIPINNSTIFNISNEAAAGFQEIDFGNGAMEVNPDDIASVSVLKGPSAAALYGTRASNGAIIIETKNGASKKGIGISFNSTNYFERPFKLPEFQNSYGQGNSGQFVFVDGLGGGINDNITYSYGPALDEGILVPQYDSPVQLQDGTVVRGGDVVVHAGSEIPATPFVSNPNNLKKFYETGWTRINNFSFSNSAEKGNFRLSFTDLNSDSYIPGVNLKRKTLSTHLNFQLSPKLKVSAAGSYLNSKSDNRPASGYGSENINYSLVAWLGRQTNLNPLKKYWQPGLENLQQYSFNYTFFDNPYFILLENKNAFQRDRLFGHLKANYKLSDNLSLNIRSGMDYSSELRTFKRAFSSNRFKSGAYAEQDVFYREINTDVLFNYQNTFSNFLINVSLGANRMNQNATTKHSQTLSLAQPAIFRLSNAASPIEVFDFSSQKRVNSIYGLIKLGFRDLLFVDITGRNDWSSALATSNSTENTSFFYPSISASYLISNNFQLPNLISFFKVRASWAQVGNDTDPYQTQSVFEAQTPYNGQPTFSAQSSIANAQLNPEKTTSYEFGTDIRFFNNRLNFDFTYYNNLTKNQILSLPIPISSGYTDQVVNGGSVRSSGIEVMLTAKPVKTSNFTWETGFNFSKNVSKVVELPDEAESITLAYSRVYDNTNQTVWFIASEGARIGDIWGTGYQKNENGDFVIGSDGKLIVDNSLKKLGNYYPDFNLGWINNLNFKGFNLGFVFDWRHGGEIVSRTQALAGVAGQLAETAYRPEEGLVFDGVINVGNEESPVYEVNTIAISPETYYRQYYDRNHEENNIHDASFLKLRELAFGYTFSKKYLKGEFFNKVESLKLSFVARNLFVISSIPHFDPEQFAIQGTGIISGVEDMSYPTARSIGLSLGVEF